MSEIEDRNIERLQIRKYPVLGEEESGRFCFLGIKNYESDNPAINRKIEKLLTETRTTYSGRVAIESCTIGGCDLEISTDLDLGRRDVKGSCKASSYCIKKSFEAVGEATDAKEGRKLYGELLDTCEGATSKYSSGNFCPKIDCDLSAGVSIDMVPGTAGECIVEIRSSQQVLDI